MRAFLGVSFAPRATGDIRHPNQHALACLREDGAEIERADDWDGGWVAFAGAEAEDRLDRPGGAFTVRLSRAVRTRQKDVSTVDIPAMLAAPEGLTSLLPPFAVAHREAPGEPIVVAGDWLGFRQLYWWQADGVAAISTSARALSVLAGGGLDDGGLAVQAMVGWQVGDATIFKGVRALPPATAATLAQGTLQMRRYAEPPRFSGEAPGLDDAVEEMASILIEWQAAYLAEHPDTVLQLTGGHDSRILLAAIPEKMRTDLNALTLGDGHNPDVMIAARLSARCGMRHQVYDLDAQQWPTPKEAQEQALTAARALECLASPLALAPLLLVEAQLDQGHRLSGLGGEVARGFYYTGQPTGATTSPHLVERLARWRLFSNEAIAEEAVKPEFFAAAQESTLATLKGLFPPGDWLRATDEFYLLHRMFRWAGVHGTVAAVRRHFINPMFDRRFIELALAVAPHDKRDSLLLGRLMTRLDPELARIPLDSGLVPARLATRSAVTRLAVHAVTARKIARKLRQRVTGARKPQFGAAHSADLVLAHWRAEPKACAALYDFPFLRPEWLDGLLAGAKTAEATTVAFLLNLLVAVEQKA
jgi:asparagine synthase (glutamine-hydrolysing)